jgi:hypothetical protein
LSRDSKAKPNPAKIEIKTSTDEEAADRFVQLFRSAVKCEKQVEANQFSAED